MTGEESFEYVVVGASAVQVGTANFVDPKACERIVDGMERLCITHNISNINEIRGSFRAEKH